MGFMLQDSKQTCYKIRRGASRLDLYSIIAGYWLVSLLSLFIQILEYELYSLYHRIALNMQLIWSNTLSRAVYICAWSAFSHVLSHIPIDVSCRLSNFNEFYEIIIKVSTSRPTLLLFFLLSRGLFIVQHDFWFGSWSRQTMTRIIYNMD